MMTKQVRVSSTLRAISGPPSSRRCSAGSHVLPGKEPLQTDQRLRVDDLSTRHGGTGLCQRPAEHANVLVLGGEAAALGDTGVLGDVGAVQPDALRRAAGRKI